MSILRLPVGGFHRTAIESGAVLLDHELLAEKAAALGRTGQKVATALNELRTFDAGGTTEGDRAALLKAASTAVWYYFIQRELCGLRDQSSAIEEYAIPAEVLRGLGVI